jgi:glycine/D-amino acid oxidase-like deaminating enzyme
VPPKGYADWAWVQHMLTSAAPRTGRVAVVLPQGALFRQGAEGRIREHVLKANLVEAVIGLAPNLFFGTGLAASVLILRQQKADDRNGKVLFVNGESLFKRGRNHNTLEPEHATTILKAVKRYDDEPGLSAVATLGKIASNGYNLNVPLYVEPADTGEAVTLEQALADLEAAHAGHAGAVATGVEATGVAVRGDDRITAVHTSIGDFQPGAVVMATGLVPPPRSRAVHQRWVKGRHLLATGPGQFRLGSVVSSDRGGASPLPGGGVLCGGSVDDGDDPPAPLPEVAAALATDLHRLLPATRRASITHRWCCFRPLVEGRHPVIDRLPGTTNGWLSAGHFTTGIMMAAATGQALASWILHDARPPQIATFDLPT